MRILHCCLAAFYIDNYSYQENILPKMHKLQGHTVKILASTETFVNNSDLGYTSPGSYINENGIPVTRLPYQKWLPHFIMKKLRFYTGIKAQLESFKPDIIFFHDAQFLSIPELVGYIKKNRNIKVFVDGHTDFINSGTNWVSKNIMHKIIYKWCVQRIVPYASKFYGVLPVRVDFFKDVYGTPPDKTELLIMGADHTVTDVSKREEISSAIRKEFNIGEQDFLIVTGGKIDSRKNIHFLLRAVIALNLKNVTLLIFGNPNEEMKQEILTGAKLDNVKFVGWANAEKSSNYFLAGDLAVFPGTHSVLWEQAVGLGIPCVFKEWEGMHHVDIGGNCVFLDEVNQQSLENILFKLISDKEKFDKMKNVARNKGIVEFSYNEIAKRAIE